MKKEVVRTWLHRAGSLLALFGLGYLFHAIYQKADAFDQLSSSTVAFAVLLALMYGCSNVLLAGAWLQILHSLGMHPSPRWVLKAYGTYQITKYVPGNVANILGRQSLCMAAGLPALPVARSTLWELGMLTCSASVYAVLLAPLHWKAIPALVAAAGFVLATFAFLLILTKLFGEALAMAQAQQAIFLLLSGLSFVALLKFLNPDAVPDTTRLLLVLGAFNVAWLVGMVTPGAPAGIGVREALIVGSLGHLVPHETLLLGVLLSRLINVFGDLMFWLGTSWLRPHGAASQPRVDTRSP